jgi:hypothetical protein
VGTDITVTTATRPASGLGQVTPEPYLSCSGLVTTPAEAVEEGSGLGGYAGWAVTCWAPMVTVAERRGRRSLRTLLMLSPARAWASPEKARAAIFGRSASAHG